MIFEINETERQLLCSLKEGIAKIKVYKAGLYPTVVTFVLVNNKKITLRAKEEGVSHRFEVFPIAVSEEVIDGEPEIEIDGSGFSNCFEITILQKAEWAVPAGEKDKSKMLGDTIGATIQYEGKASKIPSSAINQVTLHAGIEIKSKSGKSFIVSTSMFPYALYVSDCDFSESIDQNIYERLKLC